MPARRRLTLGVGLALAVSVAAGTAVLTFSKGKLWKAAGASRTIDEKTPFSALEEAMREGDSRALVVLMKKTEPNPDGTRPAAFTDAEFPEWAESLKAMRTGYMNFSTYGRALALTISGRVMQRLAQEPAPAAWTETLTPTHDLFVAGLADAGLDVRVTALSEVGRFWSWMPGRAILPTEENRLAAWKDDFRPPVERGLTDTRVKARIAAIACLGNLPIDRAAAPAIAYLNDKTGDVRKQVLISFAQRPNLLTEDAILKHMYDNEAGIPEVAEIVLKTRGLTDEQISLGSMIFHPKPEMRASVFALLKNRTDIDPVVWLLQLSRDQDETVRVGAIDAMAQRLSPEVGQRLAEMATTDTSPTVRKAASKYLPESMKTADLPPVPSSTNLHPKAN